MGVILGGYKPNVRCDSPALKPDSLSCTRLLSDMLANKRVLIFGPKGAPGVAVEIPYTIKSSEASSRVVATSCLRLILVL